MLSPTKKDEIESEVRRYVEWIRFPPYSTLADIYSSQIDRGREQPSQDTAQVERGGVTSSM
jgi:hypothetical protein